jgi:hypothetical protein
VRDYFDECLHLLATLSRKFLRFCAEDNKNECDHKSVSAAIDMGIWHDDFEVQETK